MFDWQSPLHFLTTISSKNPQQLHSEVIKQRYLWLKYLTAVNT
jgi:hypothetical protein